MLFENHPPATDPEHLSSHYPKGIVVLGSTGSIGTQTLDVIRALPDRFRVVGLAAGTRLDVLREQISEFKPRMVWATDASGVASIAGDADVVSMDRMVQEPDVDHIMVATTGRAGLGPTLEALSLGKEVSLCNKEVIVMAGDLVTATARRHNAPLFPVDSEPSAIWQCIQGEFQSVRRLIITASGGPFKDRPIDEIATVTPHQALKHPTWVMGKKITIDSSTLMNKGFEVIESHWLFDVPYSQIDVVVHPQSVIHSMVEFADGSVKAQMGPPDMRLPIQYAMLYPERVASPVIPQFNPIAYPELTFRKLEPERYPCFTIAVEAGLKGMTYPAVLSAADEEAVLLFLAGRIGFNDIPGLVAGVLDRHEPIADATVEAILGVDAWAREQVESLVRT